MKKIGFTLAEVLITLGIIGVVAAITLPILMQNIQGRIRAEQIRTVKYKFTQATDKMKSLGLIGPYDSTAAFVAQLQKHLKIAKVCTASNIRDCWPYDTVILQDGNEWDITKAQTGKQFKMKTDETHDYTSPNVGIVTADGTPMIISYNKKCSALDPSKTYPWTTEDGVPISNATANCVTGIFEINGSKNPNKQNEDVILFNANGLGSNCAIEIGGKCYTSPKPAEPMTFSECEAKKGDLGIKNCCPVSYCHDNDYWAGAVNECDGVSNLVSMGDLAKMATAIYNGNPSIGEKDNVTVSYTRGTASSLGLPEPYFWAWSNEEYSADHVYFRGYNTNITDGHNMSGYGYRHNTGGQVICRGD